MSHHKGGRKMKIEKTKDVMVKRIFEKEMPNSEAFYTEIWSSGKVVNHVLLNWFFDGDPKKLEFNLNN